MDFFKLINLRKGNLYSQKMNEKEMLKYLKNMTYK